MINENDRVPPVNYTLVADIGVITINNPPVNALSYAVRQGLLAAIRSAQSDSSKAVLIICSGRTFVAGADITEFGKPPKDPLLPDLLDEVEASTKLVVAALHGTALGGGFELALSCHRRCALDSAKVGLPEVKLGLLPGAGGTQRVPRLAGVASALELITSGRPVTATEAHELGLVDEIVSGNLFDEAMDYAQMLVDAGTPIRRTRELEVEPASGSLFDDARIRLSKKAPGQRAPQRIIDCVEAAVTLPFSEGLVRERELFLECMQDPQSLALQHLFFDERQSAKILGLSRETPVRDIHAVGVIGGGTMGGGIAMNFAKAGLAVTMIEVSDEALERGLSIIDRNYEGSVTRGKLSESDASVCRRLIRGATDYAALSEVDLVVEAVFEDPDLKKDIFAKLGRVCKPGAILATNTSYQNVDEIAEASGRAGDVIGLHFFSPAHIMKLLEVVRGARTADDVLATSMALARKIGKIPVMSRVCYGFIGNRMLQPYMREAQLCLIEGATPESIDKAMHDWGMAMGPVSVADLAGLDISYKARQALPENEKGDPLSYCVPDALVEMGRLGQKSGAGFYSYDPRTREKTSDPVVVEVIEREAKSLGVERRNVDATEIIDRLVFALVNEGLNILQEGIAQRPGDIDVVYVYGYGFPAHRGGPLHYADRFGLDKVLARILEFRDRFGALNWTPAPLLEQLVEQKMSIKEWAAVNSD